MLNKNNLDIAKLCARDASRYTLQAIQVTATDTRVTDGHCAMIVTRPTVSADDFPAIDNVTPDPTACFLLDAKTANDISKALPNGKASFPVLRNALIGTPTASGRRPIAVTDLESERIFQIQVKPSAGLFPNLDMVFAQPSEGGTPTPPAAEVYLDADLLCDLLGQIRAMVAKDKNCPVKLTIYSSEDVVRVDATSAEGQQISAAIMPLSGGKLGTCGINPRVFGADEPLPAAAEIIADPPPAGEFEPVSTESE